MHGDFFAHQFCIIYLFIILEKHLVVSLQKLVSTSGKVNIIRYRIYDLLSPGDIYQVSRSTNIISKFWKHQVNFSRILQPHMSLCKSMLK